MDFVECALCVDAEYLFSRAGQPELSAHVAMFVDQAKITVTGGKGGNGIVSFRREKHVRFGGPDGGDGGRGGDVIVMVDPKKRTLLDFHYRRYYKAGDGKSGGGKNRTGADGSDCHIPVPSGTDIEDIESADTSWDLVEPGQSITVARGGRGGRGNAHFATPTYRAPETREEGRGGQRRNLLLTLKLLADIGIIGLPNAGKSTLLSKISAARPKIASYPFTTLLPNLGLVRVDRDHSFIVADIPGIIEGAHQGRGLGLRFLQHVERTRILLFLLDGTSTSLRRDYRMLEGELERYGHGLPSKRRIVVLNKIDLLGNRLEERIAESEFACPVLHISALAGTNCTGLIYYLWDSIEKDQSEW
jgi:GTP-binding protein